MGVALFLPLGPDALLSMTLFSPLPEGGVVGTT
jgi:hypothetical protein